MTTNIVSSKNEMQGATQHNLYIDGKWVHSSSCEKIKVENPATEETIAVIPESILADVQPALQGGEYDRPEWARMPAVQQGELMLRMGQAIPQKEELLAETIARAQRKLIALARDEVVRRFDYFASWCREIEGDILHAENPDENIYNSPRALWGDRWNRHQGFFPRDRSTRTGTGIGIRWEDGRYGVDGFL